MGLLPPSPRGDPILRGPETTPLGRAVGGAGAARTTGGGEGGDGGGAETGARGGAKLGRGATDTGGGKRRGSGRGGTARVSGEGEPATLPRSIFTIGGSGAMRTGRSKRPPPRIEPSGGEAVGAAGAGVGAAGGGGATRLGLSPSL
jgi:hypothetical protein